MFIHTLNNSNCVQGKSESEYYILPASAPVPCFASVTC